MGGKISFLENMQKLTSSIYFHVAFLLFSLCSISLLFSLLYREKFVQVMEIVLLKSIVCALLSQINCGFFNSVL